MSQPSPSPDSLRSFEVPASHLAGRRILVTGAGEGIGRAVALSAARAGAAVTLLGRTAKKLEDTAEAIVAIDGAPMPVVCHFDLLRAGPDDYANLREQLEGVAPALDGLVNNAGILGLKAPLEHYPADQWMEVLHVNLTAQFLLTQALLPLLKRSEDASVIFVSSTVGREGRAYWGAYAVSKFGLEGLMQTFADEVREQGAIRVYSLNPGRTRTGMRRKAYPAEDPTTLPTAQDVAPAFIYLLGDGVPARFHGAALDA